MDCDFSFAEFERSGWDRQAASYAGLMDGAPSLRVDEQLLDAARVAPGARVVDVATGPGHLAAAAVGRGAQVIGIDVSQEMLAIAHLRHPKVEFRLGAGESMPLESSSVDAVLSSYGMPHFSDHQRFFAESKRVLVPGGRFAVSTWCPPPANAVLGLVFSTISTIGTLDVGLPPGPDVFRYANPDVCRTELAAGFLDVEVEEVPTSWSTDRGADGLLEFIERGGVRSRALLAGQTDEAKATIRTALQDALEQFRDPDGIWRIPSPAVVISASS